MAVVVTPISSEMVIVVEDGTTAAGAIKYKNRFYKNLKTTADDENVRTVGVAMSTLQTKTLSAVQRRNHEQIDPQA
ncbi:MAG: DUF1659 domain-containing protein [Syntrophomonadaceae bacterium]|nr:DUF1659 domain-containing protein [Syntrophomonadaceae bacterium]